MPAGTITPDVIQVNPNQTNKNIQMFKGIYLRASLINDLIVFICDSKNRVASLSKVGADTSFILGFSKYVKSLHLNFLVARPALASNLN